MSWFTWPNLYRKIVQEAPDRSQLVEVGVWQGESFCYLMQQARKSGKILKLFAVDTFEGGEPIQNDILKKLGGPDKLYEQFLSNVRQQRYTNYYVFRNTSVEAARFFQDRSIHMCFIDAAHDYESITKDIEAWLPKIAVGGIIAGHDYNTWPSVKEAVDDYFTAPTFVQEDCWVVLHPNGRQDNFESDTQAC